MPTTRAGHWLVTPTSSADSVRRSTPAGERPPPAAGRDTWPGNWIIGESVDSVARLPITQAMKERGYRTNTIARGLSESRSGTVGVMLNDLGIRGSSNYSRG